MAARLAPVLLTLLLASTNAAYLSSTTIAPPSTTHRHLACSRIAMLAKTTRKKKKATKGGSVKISTKGFGAAPKHAGKLLDDLKYTALYAWLGTSAETSLHKVAVADFDGLRGVMALQDIDKGEEIVAIPATFAVDLGADGADVISAAQRLLAVRAIETEPAYEPDEDEYDEETGEPLEEIPPASPRAAYWETLPPPDSPDLCTPDFFSEKQLMMLQWPPLVTETRKRSAQIRNALGAAAPSGATSVSALSAAGGGMRLLRWASWAVLSRVLTVQGPPDPTALGGGLPVGRKLLIPFIDMFNHKGGTKHYLTGRTDGMLKVKAGEPIKAGEQIFIKYGTDQTANDEFVAHYGFFDPSKEAMAADRSLVKNMQEALPALAFTSIEEDEALLKDGEMPYEEQLAVRLRLSLKKAASEEGLMPPAA